MEYCYKCGKRLGSSHVGEMVNGSIVKYHDECAPLPNIDDNGYITCHKCNHVQSWKYANCEECGTKQRSPVFTKIT